MIIRSRLWQNSFCAGTTCTITVIYDQSPEHNNLTIEGPGGNGGQDAGANAAPCRYVGGHSVYGLYVTAGVGYRDNSTRGVATGCEAQGEYMVASGVAREQQAAASTTGTPRRTAATTATATWTRST